MLQVHGWALSAQARATPHPASAISDALAQLINLVSAKRSIGASVAKHT